MNKKITIAILGIALLSGLPGSSGAAQVAAPEPLAATVVDITNLEPGRIVAQGERVGDQCSLPKVGLQISRHLNAEQVWVSIAVSDACHFVVAGHQPAPEEDKFDRDSMRFSDTPSLHSGPSVKTDARHAVGGGFSALSTSCGTSRQVAYTFGGGGPAFDKLTEVDNDVDFCWDGSTVWITGISGGCTAVQFDPPAHEWLIDACVSHSSNLGPTTGFAFHTGRGDFHCGPVSQFPCNLSNPDGYYHSLYNQASATKTGALSCTYWATGEPVNGPSALIYTGC